MYDKEHTSTPSCGLQGRDLLCQAKARLRGCKEFSSNGQAVGDRHSQFMPARISSASANQLRPTSMQLSAPGDPQHNGRVGLDDDEDGSDLCAICMERSLATRFIPCQHSIACSLCASQIMQRTRECPLCRCSLQNVVSLPDGS